MALEAPQFDKETKILTLPDQEGVEYFIGSKRVSGNVELTKNTVVRLAAKQGYKLAKGVTTDYRFDVPKAEAPKPDPVKTESEQKPAEPTPDPQTAGSTSQNPAQGTPRPPAVGRP